MPTHSLPSLSSSRRRTFARTLAALFCLCTLALPVLARAKKEARPQAGEVEPYYQAKTLDGRVLLLPAFIGEKEGYGAAYLLREGQAPMPLWVAFRLLGNQVRSLMIYSEEGGRLGELRLPPEEGPLGATFNQQPLRDITLIPSTQAQKLVRLANRSAQHRQASAALDGHRRHKARN